MNKWTPITDVRDPAFGHATHEHALKDDTEPQGLAHFWRDPINERWLGKKRGKRAPRPAEPTPQPRRTIKISDELHHKLRVRSVTDRVKMQDLIERLLDSALKA